MKLFRYLKKLRLHFRQIRYWSQYKSIETNHEIQLVNGQSFINGFKINCIGEANTLCIQGPAKIRNCTVFIRGNFNKIVINSGVFLNEVDFYMEDDHNEAVIGEHSQLMGRTHLATIEGTRIIIGKDCLFSSELQFRTGDSHSIVDLEGKRINPSEDIVISDHVWIGTKVTCLKGTNVARDSIVGATSTLCSKFEHGNTVIAGVPGRIVKTGVNWTTERIPVPTIR